MRDRDDYFSRPKQSSDALTIFLSVLAAILAAWALKAIYDEIQLRRAAAEFSRQMQIMSNRMATERPTYQYKQPQQGVAVYPSPAQQAAERKRLIEQQKAEERAKAAEVLEAKVAKERAWEEFYRPSKECESDYPGRDLMTCANEHMRAKSNFEKDWWK
ncbi:hypothetical protein [Methylobacillus sp.]|uniref:hypothetical protein n=1 Tax=Methylobacillus sp. TaxID=56818 RepID=UPI0012CF3154|nr:hypothetical protein [Methylobacillus sp.]MPS47814.1 hypothetical protein [Methylobacillus sp.]